MKQDESRQAAHTPCAWEFWPTPDKTIFEVWAETNNAAREHHVCTVHPNFFGKAEEYAQLIAAAPETARKLAELLEMAKKALVVADFTCDGQYPEAGKALEKEFEAVIKACELEQSSEATQ